MKIIDLLNKIANGEKIKKIKYQNHIYEYYNGDFKEDVGNYDSNWLFASEIIDLENLNDEVEMIEENKKIEKLPYYSLEKIQKAKNKEEHIEKRIQLLEKRMDDYHNKINEIIDKLEEIK